MTVIYWIVKKRVMKNLETEKYYKNEWVTKSIVWPDEQWYILKFFKKDCEHEPYSYEEQSSIIEKKKQYIWKFLPETELIKNDDGTYCIKQKFIEWKLLKFIDINKLDAEVLSDLLELFDWYIAYCKSEWIEMDVIGYQQDIHIHKPWWKRRFMFYSRILNGFLASTNIIISNDKRVYMIDVCDTIPISKDDIISKTKSAVRNAIMNIWIKKTKYRIHRLIKEKWKELWEVLS